MKCEKCGKEIGHLLVDTFLYDGSDTDIEQPVIECEKNAAYIETTQNWTGYDLSEDVVRVVCFKTEEGGQHE